MEADYDFNRKSCINSEIREKRVPHLDKRMIAGSLKIALIFDNCPAHPKKLNQKRKNVKVFYLLPNTKSKLHPMDRWVIKSFNVQCLKIIMRKVMTALENNQPVLMIYL